MFCEFEIDGDEIQFRDRLEGLEIVEFFSRTLGGLGEEGSRMNVPTEKWVSLIGVNDTGLSRWSKRVVAGFLRLEFSESGCAPWP